LSGFLGTNKKTSVTVYSGLQVQTTSSCLPIPICYGANLLTPNVIWYNDFQQHKSGGKAGGKGGALGGGGSSNSYTYSASIIMALCEGQISGIGNVWTGTPTAVTLSTVGLSLANGAVSQAVWSYLASAHSDQALTYNGTAYLYAQNFNLGPSASVGDNSFEVFGLLYQSGFNGIDADPALVIQDFLTNARYGCGFPASAINTASLLGSTGDSSFQTYCWATGLAISPFLNTQEKANSIIARWLQITNSTAVWTGGQLKIIPFGDYTTSGNGRTWNPNVTPLYDLSDEDFVGDGSDDPLKVVRTDPFSAYNEQTIEISARSDQYNTGPILAWDQSAIDRFGRRDGSSITAHEVTDLTIARTAVQLILQRGLYVRNTYQFKLSWEFCLLDPMDMVTLTDPVLGMNKVAVRITDIEEDDSGLLTITAEEFPQGVATASAYATQIKSNGVPNTNQAPGSINAPIIFEPPGQLSGALQVWVAASGVTPATWGGCNVWASLDGSSYMQVGTIHGPARMGVLSASLAPVTPATSGLTIDTTNTLAVNLTESAGQLLSGSLTDAQNGVTICYVDGEYLAYETATLTGTDLYNLTYLVRGLYGSAASIVSHASGAGFVFLDSAIFRWTYNNYNIGQAVSLKFTSFNIWGTSEESLASVPAYTHTLSGTPTPGTLTIITSTLTQAPGGVSLTLGASWSSDPLAVTYLAEMSADTGVTWTVIYTGPGTQLSVSGLGQQDLLFRVAGVSANSVRGPWATDGVTSPIIYYGPAQQITLVTYDQLSTSVIETLQLGAMQSLDDLAAVVAESGAAVQQHITQVQAATGAAQAGVTQTMTAVASATQALADYKVVVNAQIDANIATISQESQARADADTALANTVTSVSAMTAAGTANGKFVMAASSGVGTGVNSAIEMGVSTAGVGGVTSYAGMYLQAMNDGSSQIVFDASKIWFLNGSTKTAVFGTNADGSLTLQGITRIASVIQSTATTGSGTPVMQMDFVNGILQIARS
jgi:hypothetical protein